MSKQATLFDAQRLTLRESIDLTVESIESYGPRYDHWAIAYSGGKDSSALLTLTAWLIRTGQIAAPKRLTVCYADTRMELPPLAAAAQGMLARLRSEGVEVREVVAEMDKRFLVYMLGRGVPPPNNSTFRWCTRQIKVDPMHDALRLLHGETGQKILMLTGVRVGESAARDARISLSCSVNGAECGQGWYQQTLSGATCDTLAPILHWRTCLVWDWLSGEAGNPYRDLTRQVAWAYGAGDDDTSEGRAVESNCRTGCNGCPLATQDTALDNLLRQDRWQHLAPLKELRPLYRWLREPAQRLRKPGFELHKDGSRRPTNRLGPLTFEARRHALAAVLDIQARCNAARPAGAAMVDTLDAEEVARITELIAAGTWPQRWSGDEPTGDEPFERCHADGSTQTVLYWPLTPAPPPPASDAPSAD